MTRGSVCLITAIVVTLAAPRAMAETPYARWGVEVGTGLGRAGPTWVGGPWLGLRGGIQVTRGFALDALVVGESLILWGRGHLGALAELSYGRFALAGGGGVGASYSLHYGYSADTASFGLGILRLEILVSELPAYEGQRIDRIVVGIEGVLGATFAGNVLDLDENYRYVREYPLQPGTPAGGASIFCGIHY